MSEQREKVTQPISPPERRTLIHIFDDPDLTHVAFCGWQADPDLPIHYRDDLEAAECVVCVQMARTRGFNV